MDAFTRESRRLRDPAEPEFSNSGHCRLLQSATCAVDANLTRDFVDLIKQLPIATTLTGPDKLLITIAHGSKRSNDEGFIRVFFFVRRATNCLRGP
jgi:hypothetical protein